MIGGDRKVRFHSISKRAFFLLVEFFYQHRVWYTDEQVIDRNFGGGRKEGN